MICWGRSDIGKNRKMNQDAFVIKQNGSSILALVCDGMGGAKAGEVASRMACDKIAEYFDEHPDLSVDTMENWLYGAVMYANDAVFAASINRSDYFGMGTTLVGFLKVNDKIISVNVGDSRLYRFFNHRIAQLTVDHSLVYELLQRGLISEEETKNHPQRHVLTNALGISKAIRIDIHPIEEPFDLLLVASDGLHSMLQDEEIQRILDEKEPPQAVCDRLIDEANDAGGSDNITVILAAARPEVRHG